LNQELQMFDALSRAGRDAAEITSLFWIMTAGATVIWLLVTALALYAARARSSPWSESAALKLIAIGGAAFPTVVVTALLVYGMPSLASQLEIADDATVRMTVIGEQWWWRVRYELPGGGHVELANEVRLPRDRVAAVMLTSTNVIHSFWVPALAGKIDMIPGRFTRLTLEPTIAGTYRGVCAEYCGASHARMGFVVEVMEPDGFDRWLEAEARPGPATDDTKAGATAFLAHGCAACHAIRGTAADGTIGPDLSHLGSRHSIAAATLPNDADHIARFVARPDLVKPGALMPGFHMLPEADLQSIAAYLRSLQ
jgi:cytochrome c oxidase subunit 2